MDKILTLLLVDDDEDDREFFSMIAGENDCNVITFNDGLHFLEKVSNNNMEKPDLIFLDINMPLMSGLECLQHLRQVESYKEIPVVIYTTSGNDQDIDDARTYGANAFMKKPNSMKELKKNISSLISIDWSKKPPFSGELLFLGF